MLTRYAVAVWNYVRNPAAGLSSAANRSLRDEIEFHLQESMRDHVERGRSPQEAHQAAGREFGSVEATIRDCHTVDARSQVVCHRLHLLLTAGLLIAVGFLAAARTSSAPESPPADAVVTTETGDIVGQVVDQDSQPIENAHILAVVKTWPPNGYRQQAFMTTTGHGGRFSIDDVYSLDEHYEVQIAAVADGRLLQSQYIANQSGGNLDAVAFRLGPTATFQMQIRDAAGAPIEGVEAFPYKRVGAGAQDHIVYFQSADPIIRRSDADGLVPLPYFHSGERATIYLRVPGADWETREIIVPSEGGVLVLQADDEHSPTQPGA